MMQDVMVDIETASDSTHNAVVLSIGWVPFSIDPHEVRPATVLFPSVREQLAMGREVAESTMRWWAKQSPEARSAWTNVLENSVADVLHMLRESFGPGTRIWAHGCAFDVGNVESLFRAIGRDIPWAFNDVRDARTLHRILPVRAERKDAPAPEGAAHDPVYDCLIQINNLWKRWPDGAVLA